MILRCNDSISNIENLSMHINSEDANSYRKKYACASHKPIQFNGHFDEVIYTDELISIYLSWEAYFLTIIMS